MIYVVSAPRSGSTFVMETLHHLGYRINHWYDSRTRSGNEDLYFNRLSVRLQNVLSLVPPEMVQVAVRQRIIVPSYRDVLPGEMREVLDRCWEDYDAIKDAEGGHLLAVCCSLGYVPDKVLIVMRNVLEIQQKYGMVPSPFPNVMSGYPCHYAIYGLVLDCCSCWGIEQVTVRYGEMVEGRYYGLAEFLGKDCKQLEEAISRSLLVWQKGNDLGATEGMG